MPLISLSSDQAKANMRSGRIALWPLSARDQARLQGVATVETRPGFSFAPGEAIFTVGSCFARNIETRLHALGFTLPTLQLELATEERGQGAANNVLNKYTPFSILNEFRWALDPAAAFPEAGFVQVDDALWSDPHTAYQIRPASLERVRERRRMVADLYRQLAACRVIVMTLGLVESWYDTVTGLHLNGSPQPESLRREPDRFQLHVLSVDEIGSALDEIHDLLRRFGHPDFRILITISPVPLNATLRGIDVITANTYSKSALRAAAEGFVLGHPEVDYFPSYEIVAHTDRGMAFGEDCRHVARPVVSAIVDRMVEAYVPATAAAAAAPEDGQPTADQARRRVHDSVKRKNYAKAINILRGLEADGWQAAGYDEFDFRLEYGRVLLLDDQFIAAEPQLSRANALEPTSVVVLLGLARARRQIGRGREAEACLAQAVELNPEDARIRYLLAADMARGGRHGQAIVQLLRCLEIEPGHEAARALLEECNRRVGGSWADEAAPIVAAEPRPSRSLIDGLFKRRP